MEILIKIAQLILSLSLLVFVHELGHYLWARVFGIRVEKFYLFFDAGGFSLFKFRIGETTFGMGWVPFGGYCKIAGMIDESMDTEAMAAEPKPWEFRSKPAWQRLVVMVGGVVMNVVCAFAIYTGMSWHWGESYIANDDLQWGWYFNPLAEEIGFRDGDRVVSFDGKPVKGSFGRVYTDMLVGGVRNVGVERSVVDVYEYAVAGVGDSSVGVSENSSVGSYESEGGGNYVEVPGASGVGAHGSGEAVDYVEVQVEIPEDAVARMLTSEDFMLPRVPFVDGGLARVDSLVAAGGSPVDYLEEYQGAIAEYLPVHRRTFGFVDGLAAGFRRTGAEIRGYWAQLKLIFSPKTEAYKQVGSLISIGSIFPGEWDWWGFWRITAFLSIILAVMNILPIPALDGGHVLFLLWEVVTRRKPSDRFLEYAQMFGMLLLLGILVLAFWNDIYRFFIK